MPTSGSGRTSSTSGRFNRGNLPKARGVGTSKAAKLATKGTGLKTRVSKTGKLTIIGGGHKARARARQTYKSLTGRGQSGSAVRKGGR